MTLNENLTERLKQAEMAEREVMRLQSLAEEAPQLREQRAKAQKDDDRRRAKDQAFNQARNSVQTAVDRQKQVPELLGNAGRAVMELFAALKEIDSQRRKATESLRVTDRIDYDIELEEGEEREQSMGRDTRGLAFALAGRHGEARVRGMLEELDPGFNLLRGCNMDDPLFRDVANFVVRHAVPKEAPPTTTLNANDAPPPKAAPAPMAPNPVAVAD
jgi:hypothetical protein